MKSTPVSRRESEVMEMVRRYDLTIFGPTDLQRFLGISRENAFRVLTNMKGKDLVRNVERGKYILTPVYEGMDIYEIASYLFPPSYLAFWSALHFHSMTEQVPMKVFLATTGRKRPMVLEGRPVVFVSIAKRMFFGYERHGRILVSDREKTLIDCLRHPHLSGGIDQIYRSIPDDLDTERVVDYCVLTGSTTIASRLGYMLDLKGFDHDRKKLKRLIKTYSTLDPTRERVRPDRGWRLYVNRVITC